MIDEEIVRLWREYFAACDRYAESRDVRDFHAMKRIEARLREWAGVGTGGLRP